MTPKNEKAVYEVIKNVLTYTGIILTILSGIAYILIVSIMIYGFEAAYNKTALIGFLILGAITGVLINLSLRIQGIDFAKLTSEAKETMKELTDLKGKSKEVKLAPMWQMFLTTIIKDIIIKGGTIGLSLYFVIDVSYKGLQENKYFYLAWANLLLYLGLGLLSMNKSYDFYIENEIPLMKQKIMKLKEGESDKNAQEIVRTNERKN